MALILGLDTSCDDTGIGIVRGHEVLANVVASQNALHAKFGGVLPEQASREHLNVIDAVLEAALLQAKIKLSDIDIVAATYGPGLVGALLVGLSYGKALAWSLGKPFVPVHHLEGHLASSLASGNVEPPFLCLIVSGGHTSLFAVKAWGDYQELGRSRDDAAGEAFDKVARLLGLGFPGGPALSKAAEVGDDNAHKFTIALKGQTGFDFSFSGLKTAVSVLLQKEPHANPHNVAASFEKTVVESLIAVTARAAKTTGYSKIVVAGGVAANKRLRQRFTEIGLQTFFPPIALATDNGAMIALAAQFYSLSFEGEGRGEVGVDARPYLPLDTSLRSRASS
ncbi:MAG: tRNA (adenosine(37)-N6)-threonylcarbamoyltransferase complex transferase subunit TsaD [Trueperaceae bacterium]